MPEIKVGIITVSDSCHEGRRDDTAGPAVGAMCEARGWSLVSYHVCCDDAESIVTSIGEISDVDEADVIFTVGGTGFSPRDLTPEATVLACERLVPGIPEAIRAESYKITKRAMLSRAIAGIRGSTLVVNLPGSEKAATESAGFVLDQVEHAVEMMRGGGHD